MSHSIVRHAQPAVDINVVDTAGRRAPYGRRQLWATPAVHRLLRRSGSVGSLQRLEFTLANADDAVRLPRRGLSMVANDSGGEKVITLKARDLFHVARSADFAKHAPLRRALDDLTVNRIGTYGYVHDGAENARPRAHPSRREDFLRAAHTTVAAPTDSARRPKAAAGTSHSHRCHLPLSTN